MIRFNLPIRIILFQLSKLYLKVNKEKTMYLLLTECVSFEPPETPSFIFPELIPPRGLRFWAISRLTRQEIAS